MTRRQRLTMVELPLGAPVILAGIRTAAVWTIGAATLATTVGQPSLGNLIFSGLQTENWVRVLVGCAAAAALALGVDGLLALIEAGLAAPLALADRLGPGRARRRRWRSPSRRSSGAAARRRDGGDRRQEFLRAIYLGERDRAPAPGRRLPHRAARQSRLDRRLSGARGRRYRRLCRLWRDALGQHPAAHRHAAARGDAGGADRASCARRDGVLRDRRARLRECLCAGDAAAPAPRRSACARSTILPAPRRGSPSAPTSNS